MAASKVIAIIRIFLNVGILGAASAVIAGIVRSKMETNDHLHAGSCLLWATVKIQLPNLAIHPANASSCHFSTVASVISIVLALLLTGILVYGLRSGDTGSRTCMSCVEVVFMVGNLCLVIAMVITISGGLLTFCGNLKKVNGINSHLSCQQIPLSRDGKDPYFFFHDLYVAQVGAWMVACLWLVHTVLSGINFCQYRKGKKNADTVGIRTGPGDDEEEKALLA